MGSLRFQILASGSKGNATLVWSDNTCVLIDAGLSCKRILERMDNSPVNPDDVCAIVVSHEHADHIKGVGVFSRRYRVPVYFSEGTFNCLPRSVGNLHERRLFFRGRRFSIGDLTFFPFSVSHDAEDPVGFIVNSNGRKLALCTDLGIVTNLVRESLKGCHALVIEANHEIGKLVEGPYPWHLKQRIKSRIGHLSNDDSLKLCQELYHSELHVVEFAHLSEVNNSPEILSGKIKSRLSHSYWRYVTLEIADQHTPGRVFEL